MVDKKISVSQEEIERILAIYSDQYYEEMNDASDGGSSYEWAQNEGKYDAISELKQEFRDLFKRKTLELARDKEIQEYRASLQTGGGQEMSNQGGIVVESKVEPLDWSKFGDLEVMSDELVVHFHHDLKEADIRLFEDCIKEIKEGSDK